MKLSRAHSGIKFSIHPLAHAAYEWIHAYPKLINWNNLSPLIAKQLLQQPLQGVMLYKNERSNRKKQPYSFQLYAPLWPALYWEKHTPPPGTLLIHNSSSNILSNEYIEEQAWISTLSLLFMSVNNGELAMLREHFQSFLTRDIALKIFGKSQITDIDICEWAGCNRSTLVQQRRRAKPNTQPEMESKDPLTLLNSDWNPAHDK